MWDYRTLRFLPERVTWGRVPPRNCPLASPEELRKRKATTEAAIVLWWDAHNVTVYCPFCHRTHDHGIQHFASDEISGRFRLGDRGQYTYSGPSSHRCESRGSKCIGDVPLSVEYTILFPFEADPRVEGLSFELEILPESPQNDKKERFRTVGLETELDVTSNDLPEYETEDGKELRQRLQRMEIDEIDFNVTLKIGEEECVQKASETLVENVIRGKLKAIEDILRLSSNTRNLVNIRDDKGCSLLSLATQNGHTNVVRYFTSIGADINTTDMRGRTPLMEAALWGHVELLYFLLQQGADNQKVDKDGMQASDFAIESEKNEEERHRRSFRYSEDPFIKKRHRRLILGLLGQKPSIHPINTIEAKDLQGAYFHKSADTRTISFVIPNRGIRIATQQKTMAFLNREAPFPVVGARSGWSGTGCKEFTLPEAGFQILDAAYWMPNILELGRLIGFNFHAHSWDDKNLPGSYFASHAEAQLMGFFLRRNYLFREYCDGDTVKDDFLQLFLLQKRNRQASIIISSPPCDSCKSLADYVLRTLDIHFNFIVLEVSRRYKCPKCYSEWEAKLTSKSSYYCLTCGEKRSDWENRIV
ncbi:hypothetical protein PISL3812_08135 [Talaromyces islandicus]|uniref:Single-strand DNA deaminase toxin A-like C-terminal domain-containing protein n=1 Tax=Talaromyces islandicus TaxID=28573 RepID=A0A0U1M6D1_TALIS|nr:hypothetical protein PISL3812_08135 [Talaromyces islandicus]